MEEHDELEDLIGIEEQSRDKECCRCHKLYPVNFGDYVTNYCDECGRDMILTDEDHL
jgi:hypothetical protein